MNNTDVKFGVIIPFYGVENYIRTCLDSLVKQSYQNFIAILIDDESKDGSRKIAESYVKKYPDHFKIFEEKNQGVGGARNFGFTCLPESVDYFLFLDSDDYLNEKLLEKANAVLSKETYDIFGYNYSEMDDNGHIFGTYNLCDNKTGAANVEDIKKNICFTTCVPGRIYKKSFWAETNVSFPTKLWYEDTAIGPYITSRCKKMYLLNESLYNYIQRNQSTMNNSKIRKMMDVVSSLDYLKDLFVKSNSYNEYKKEIEAVTATSVIVIVNRLNMFERGTSLQSKLSDYLFKRYPNCENNDYLGTIITERLKLLKRKSFFSYYIKYSMKPKLNMCIKNLIPKKLIELYRNRKYGTR